MRSKHCEDCKKCVRRYDHHCPWLETCVGEKNHKYFWMFLGLMSILILWTFIITWYVYAFVEIYSITILAFCDKVFQWLAAGLWFSPGITPVSSTNKTDCHDISEILLKVTLYTIPLTLLLHSEYWIWILNQE